MSARVERKYMAHYLDTTFSYVPGVAISHTPSWYRLGEDLEEYNIELNPNIEIQKNWLGDDIILHDGYEMTAEASPFYVYKNDDLHQKLFAIMRDLKEGAACYTLSLEVRLWANITVRGTSGFNAIMRPCYVVPTSTGGDTSGVQIPFTVYYLNTFMEYGAFVPDGSGSGTFTY